MGVKMTVLTGPNTNPNRNPNHNPKNLSLTISLTRSRPVRAANYGRLWSVVTSVKPGAYTDPQTP